MTLHPRLQSEIPYNRTTQVTTNSEASEKKKTTTNPSLSSAFYHLSKETPVVKTPARYIYTDTKENSPPSSISSSPLFLFDEELNVPPPSSTTSFLEVSQFGPFVERPKTDFNHRKVSESSTSGLSQFFSSNATTTVSAKENAKQQLLQQSCLLVSLN